MKQPMLIVFWAKLDRLLFTEEEKPRKKSKTAPEETVEGEFQERAN